MTSTPLLASYFTLAGDIVPLRDTGVSPFDFRDRVEAAGRAGFQGFGMFFADLPPTLDRYGYAGMRSILADNGITRLELEALIDWFADGDRGAASLPTRRLLLQSAEALGAYHVKAAGDMSGDWPLERMTEAFAQLCDEAAVAGTLISIEVIAFSNLATLDRTMAVIDGAGRPNGGLLLDIWHLVRRGVSFADVAALPGRVVHGVELNDAAAVAEGTLFEDTVFRRRFCGEGAFDIAGFVTAVRATGYQGLYGCEVLNDDIRKMPLDAAARLAFETTAVQLSAGAGSGHRSG